MQKKRRQKGLRVSNFALLLVVYKLHHGSEGVKGLQSSEWLLTGSDMPFRRVAKGSLVVDSTVICRCKGSHSTQIVHWQWCVIVRGPKVLTDCSLAVMCHCKRSQSTQWLFVGREVSLKGVMKYSLTVQLAVMCYFNGLQSTRGLLIWQCCVIIRRREVLTDCSLAMMCHCKGSQSTHRLFIASDVSL